MTLENLQYDSDYINYEIDFNTILEGINKYKRFIYVIDSHGYPDNINVEYFKNVSIDQKGHYISVNKEAVNPFSDFNDYYARLIEAMSFMADNASDKLRSHKYGLVTTISKGYDAPCCAAIAKKIGCNTAITFKAEGKYKDDCGTEVAKAIGYTNIIEVDANEYLNRMDLVEAEYICSGELGAQISFSSFDKFIRGNICFTGERGDSIWGRSSEKCNNELSFIDMLSHLEGCERRLWLNCISVPMPLFGATSWTSIYDISNSDEMKPWSLSNNYDRPIPRRIVEESGVDRNQFGITKHGAGFVYKFDWLSRILNRMSPTTAADFKTYVKNNKKRNYIQVLGFFWKLRGTYLRRLNIKIKTLSVKEYSAIANPMAARYLIPWAGEHMLRRYKEILERQTR